MARTVAMSLLAVILFSAGCASPSERRFLSGVTNRPARDFALKDLSGTVVKSSELLGKPVVLAFWAYG